MSTIIRCPLCPSFPQCKRLPTRLSQPPIPGIRQTWLAKFPARRAPRPACHPSDLRTETLLITVILVALGVVMYIFQNQLVNDLKPVAAWMHASVRYSIGRDGTAHAIVQPTSRVPDPNRRHAGHVVSPGTWCCDTSVRQLTGLSSSAKKL
jgi:hypothetical protein